MSAKATSVLSPMSPARGDAVGEMSEFSWQESAQRNAWIAAVASAAVLVWAYWLMFVDAAEHWQQPQYSHGWVLPLIALYMMWRLRPNKKVDPRIETALQGIGVVSLALLVAGQWIEGFSFLQGIGISIACLGGFACTLWGQPFATLADSQNAHSRFDRPNVLWGIVAAGLGVTTIGLLGFSVGPLSPDVFSMLGMMFLIIGIILTAAFAMPSPVVSWNEIAAGAIVMLFCTVTWLSGVYYDRMPLAEVSFIATALGILTIVGGMRLVRWCGPPIAFLLFMFPLPQLIEQRFLGMLQKIAVVLSEMVYTLLGISAVRSGSTITLPGLKNEIPMEIAQACSGLSMTNILIAMCVALVILMDRPWWDRLIVLLSALPIAIISNVFRIVFTGFVWMALDRFVAGDPEYLARLRDPVHSWLGLIVMMPFALGLLLLEWKLLSMLSVPEKSHMDQGHVLGRGGGGAAPIR